MVSGPKGPVECWMCGDRTVDHTELDARGRCCDRAACDKRAAELVMRARVEGAAAPRWPPLRGLRLDGNMARQDIRTDRHALERGRRPR